jgi:hypothetical protein
MKTKTIGVAGCVGAALVFTVVFATVSRSSEGPKGEPSPEVRRLLTAARNNGENELNLSWGSTFGGADGAKRFAAFFHRMYGTAIKVNFTRVHR